MGLAYLPDGTSIDYREYIEKCPHWQVVRKARFEFDNHSCIICHTDLCGERFETHHMNYSHLGNEHMRDVVTMCPKCHTKFHNVWRKQDFWKGREADHWEAFDIEHTARLCAAYYHDDKFISKIVTGPNLCNKNTQREYIDTYFKNFNITYPISLDPNDIGLFVRNKRYELFFEAESRGQDMEQFLDECYGEKVRGKNPIRQEAGQFFQKHEPKSLHRHYKENRNINQLMQEVKKIENKED